MEISNHQTNSKKDQNEPAYQINLALNQAALRESVSDVKKFLQQNGDPNWKNPNKSQFLNSALHNAAFKGNAEICKILVQNGALTEIENKYGNKPLMFACYYGSLDCVRVLLDSGADVSAYSSKTGLTALHKACMQGNVKVVELLLEKGAFIYSIDRKGRTPEQVIGVEGERTPTEKEVLKITKLLHDGGGKRIFSGLHKGHELAFTVTFQPSEVCSNCRKTVDMGTPLYLCHQCNYKLCAQCLGDAMSMSEITDGTSVHTANKNEEAQADKRFGWWFFKMCDCMF